MVETAPPASRIGHLKWWRPPLPRAVLGTRNGGERPYREPYWAPEMVGTATPVGRTWASEMVET